MEPRSEQGTNEGSSARHATANHPDCTKNYEWSPGTYARDRMTDYNLQCRVSLLRVHVRNSNKICTSRRRCSLKKFDILSEQGANWAYIGRFIMPDPGQTVSSKRCSKQYLYTFRTVPVFHSKRSHSVWMEMGSRMRQNTLHLWLVVMRPTMEKQWTRITMARARQSARSSLKPLLVSDDI